MGAFRTRRGSAGRVDNHKRVKILTGEQDIQRFDVMFAAGVITQIQRIGNIYVRGKRLP